jgi:hypothetical protein
MKVARSCSSEKSCLGVRRKKRKIRDGSAQAAFESDAPGAWGP